jgi:hypothetical protein
MRLIIASFAAALALAAPTAVSAQAGMNVGMQVTDASGGPVGTVKAIQGANLLIKTDKHEALLPATSFTVSKGKLLFGMTQAQLDSQIEQSLAAAKAAITAGATVKGTAGTPLGTIDSVVDGKVTMTLENGKKIAVPQEGFRGNPDGSVTIGFTADQLEAIVSGPAEAPTEGE